MDPLRLVPAAVSLSVVSRAGPDGTEAWPEASNPWRGRMSSSPLVGCPDCGHLLSPQAETCPSCARPLRTSAPREGLFLRTMNQAVAAVVLIPLFFLLVLLGTGVIAYFLGYFNPPR